MWSRSLLQSIVVATLAALTGAGIVWYISLTPSLPPEPPRAADAAAQHPLPPHPVLAHMQVIAQYEGPLLDTLIQRLRDPIDGTTCYVYLPIAVHHTPPTADTGYVEYGSNAVGSISCFAAPPPHAGAFTQK